jgi:hypothetical protein
MKKQNTINKLAFNKAAVTELNGMQLQTVNGGTGSTQYLGDITTFLNASKNTLCHSDLVMN